MTIAQVSTDWNDLLWCDANVELIMRTNSKVSSDPEKNWIEYTLSKHLFDRLPMENCLIFGCGRGDIEHYLASKNAFIHCDGYEDHGEKAVELAINKAQAENLHHISYQIIDMNNPVLRKNYYDAVWVNGALSHIENLDYVCHEIRLSLKPDGLFILNDYIGPSRFQFPDRQKKVSNICLQLLPPEYRVVHNSLPQERSHIPTQKGTSWWIYRLMDKMREGGLLRAIRHRIKANLTKWSGKPLIKTEIKFPTVRDVKAYDSTLAIRSGEIVPVLRKYFDFIEIRGWGGNILNFLLNSILSNFSENDPISQVYLKMLITIEDALLDAGQFDSDFAYIVSRPLQDPT